MNILVPHSWLKKYLKTEASPKEIEEKLSLCGPSVEKVEKIGKDYVYDIEITTNRVDAMSILGVAREANAILSRFGIEAELTKDPYKLKPEKYTVKNNIKPLKVDIKNPDLVPRFTAVKINNVQIKESNPKIKKQLELVGIRSLNNVIDISNYLMHELGQPVHVFDYDKIADQKMIVRESKPGEKITTLDGKTHKLPGNDIVIEDGEGKLIDLCGIMGGKNSAVDRKTENVLLFVQNYEAKHIRETSMQLAHRTQAASLFEKEIDPELVMPTLLKAVQLIKQEANGKPNKEIVDIYQQPYKQKCISTTLQKSESVLGVELQKSEVEQHIKNLGFEILKSKEEVLKIGIPSWRAKDINIEEDIIEEVARIYGYHNLPSKLPPLKTLPKQPKLEFKWEEKAKHTLKNWGLTEIYSYSLQDKEEIKNTNLNPKDHLKLKNPLSSEWVYLRKSIVPSLLSVLKKNKGTKEPLKLFEIANIYHPLTNKLPQEKQVLTIAYNQDCFFNLKGLCTALIEELGITRISYKKNNKTKYWNPNASAKIVHDKEGVLGYIGKIRNNICKKFELENATAAEINFQKINKLANQRKTYHPIPKYPPVIDDLTFLFDQQTAYRDILKAIKQASNLVHQVKLIDTYQNALTFRISYLNKKGNLSEKKAAKIRKKIVSAVEKINGKLKGKLS